jgi:hypothetical protein
MDGGAPQQGTLRDEDVTHGHIIGHGGSGVVRERK